MADREQPYDPYIPAAGGAPNAGAQGQNGNHRTAALQAVRLSLSLVLKTRRAVSEPANRMRIPDSIGSSSWTCGELA
jgi:hypothetical protein